MNGKHYEFGELKAGDKFTHKEIEYQKISGNTAEILVNGESAPEGKPFKSQEFAGRTTVYLYEAW